MILEPDNIKAMIATAEADAKAITEEFNQKKADMEAATARWQQYGQLSQLKLTRLEGRIIAFNELLKEAEATAPPPEA